MTGKPSSANRRDSGSAGWLLSLIFVGLATGIMAAGYYYYRHYESNYRSQVERQLSAIAELKVSELVQWRKERLADGAVFFKNGSFSGLVRRLFEKPDDAQAQREIQAWIGKYQDHTQYDEVRLQDAQGVTRLLLPAGLQAISASVATSISEVLRSGQVTLVDFYRSKQDQRVHLGVLVPIFDEPDASRPLGVVFLRIDPEIYLYPFIQRWPTPSLTAETLLVRREGSEVVYLNELRFQKDAALTLRRPLDQAALPAARAASGQEGVMEGKDYRGVPVVAALRAIPDSPWSLVSRMDAAELYAPLREQLRLVVVLISALLLGAGAGVGLVWRQQRVRFFRTKYAAEEARAALAAIVESSEDAIIGKSLDGTITSWNAGAERLFGYPAAEMIGQPVTRLIPLESQPWEAEILKRLRRGERLEHYEAVRIAKDGRRIAVSLTISPVFDAAGTITGAAKIVRDITERKRTEEAMQESQAFYSSLVAHLPAGVFRKDREGRYIFVSPGFCQLKGMEKEEFLGKTPQEVAASEAAKKDPTGQAIKYAFEGADQHALIMQTGKPVELVEEYTVAAGGKQFVHAIKIPVFNSDGKIMGTQGLLFDITARKRAEEALRESESRFRQLAESLPQLVWTCQPDGQCDYLNRQWVEFTGVPEAQQHGFGWLEKLHPDDRAPTVAAWEAAVASGSDFRVEFRIRRHDGEYRWFDTQAVRLRDAGGHTVKWFGSNTDMTERKQAEATLQESEARFVQFMRNLPALTFIKDCERRIVFVNERVGQVFGLTAADCLGKVSEDLWPGPLGQEIREEDERVLGNGEVMTVVQEIPTRDGLRVFRAIKFLIPRGQLPPLLGDISLDVTEIRQAEEKVRQLNAELEQRVVERTAELETANKELEAFSYSVSHDLRAPLRAMDGFSMALLEDCAGKLDETAQDHLRRIRAGSQRMAELIDDLLNLSQVTRTEMRRESVDLTAMAEEIGAEFQRAHPDRKVKSVVAPALTADADARMLRMVLNNLLDNAWKFTARSAQARIEVGAREQDGQRVFFVRDNGAGFDMAYAGRLFGAFQRLHSTEEFEGTGIGLAIVQRIIHRHGGRVWAEGAVGQGTTIYFTLKGK